MGPSAAKTTVAEQRFWNDIGQMEEPRSVFLFIDQSVITSEPFGVGFGYKRPHEVG
jgi:hypothetical protein